MKQSARYAKIVEWSEEDQCYVGSSPGLFYGGCHGADEAAVYHELVEIVEETVALYVAEGRQLPLRFQVKTMPTRCSTWHKRSFQRTAFGGR